MKFKKQIFALGAIAMIAAPVITVVSCGSAHSANKPKKVSYFAQKASTNGRKVTIGEIKDQEGWVTYSARPLIKGSTFTKTLPNRPVAVYTVTETPTNNNVKFTKKVGNKQSPTIIDGTSTPGLTTAIVLTDSSGAYYIPNPTDEQNHSIMKWVNYNTRILGGTTDKLTAIKNIDAVLTSTDLYITKITFGANKSIATLKVESHSYFSQDTTQPINY